MRLLTHSSVLLALGFALSAAAQVLSSPMGTPTLSSPVGTPSALPHGQGAGVHSPLSPFAPLKPRSDVVAWSVLTDVKTVVQNKRIVPVYTPAVLALNQQTGVATDMGRIRDTVDTLDYLTTALGATARDRDAKETETEKARADLAALESEKRALELKHDAIFAKLEEAVEAALVLYRQHACDGLVAIGGGSPIDLAKGVALLATHPGSLETYAAILGGIPKVTSAVAPVIAVPTTSGTVITMRAAA